MSAVQVTHRSGEEMWLTVYHPSLDAQQMTRIRSAYEKSAGYRTNAALSLVCGVASALIYLRSPEPSLPVMTVALSLLGLWLWFYEAAFGYRRFEKLARRCLLPVEEFTASACIPASRPAAQRTLREIVASFHRTESTLEKIRLTAILYRLAVTYRDEALVDMELVDHASLLLNHDITLDQAGAPR